ncbi:alpha/beta hydrolase [Dinoroseobacter sp. PD6]|uniref:alpha/beta hydrolase n=1 Tax=Dinoroseobacter sp. PD6 TaxID=3028384 RepID=UPI00237B6D17|nr:alpha/beta hydrolase [Dinoroseobacter sp. PD6]MDD9716936.1 alpha/beta hydrolase [Dinoroseobacter sp. PD6]
MDWTAAYDNASFIPGASAYVERWPRAAAAFREGARGEIGIAHGAHPREKLDLFLPEGPPEGLVVFVHGGYWRRFDRTDWSHFAAGPLARGWAVAMPGYPLCPEVTIPEITASVRGAIALAARHVAGPIRLTGHSAGGHLVARMPAAGLAPEVLSRVARIVPISPVSDLAPLLRTEMAETLRLTPEIAAAESPLHAPAPDCPVTVWVGAEERPVFLDQARWLAEAWGAQHRIAAGRHHFDVIDDLAEPDGPLTSALLA